MVSRHNSFRTSKAPTPPRRLAFNKGKQHSHPLSGAAITSTFGRAPPASLMSTYTSQSQVERLINAIGIENVTASDFVLTLLERDSLQANTCTQSLLDITERIIEAFSKNPVSAPSTYTWARKAIQKSTTQAIKILTANDDWHFNAEHALAADLEDFKIEEMAARMKKLAPDLWTLLQILLSWDEIDVDGDQVMDDLSDADEFDESGEFASTGKNAKERHRNTIRNIVESELRLPDVAVL
ncbi:hypothetical protein DFH08DRAFT_969423 [Mycena albidolilacea]|uniref:Uncharacterized protein n=1 Tax=Mycena albidolilacea TaxID=1033008 RepID=A0AAD7EHC3_9AGAR|nr:hypothetical protein DFH08DRAFT_969423 [Mycena albidolilacea]